MHSRDCASRAFLCSERGFKAQGRNDLVLLRATDTPLGDGHDVTQLQASSLSSTMAVVKAGLGKVEEMILAYSSKKEENKETYNSADV